MAIDTAVLGRAGLRRWRGWVRTGLIALAVVGGLAVVDRVLVGVAEQRLAGRIACAGALTGPVKVHIGGFPFLTEVATGRVGKVTVTAAGLDARGGTAGPDRQLALTGLTLTVHDLRLPPMGGLVGRDGASAATVGSATVAATLPYSAVRTALRTLGGGSRGTAVSGVPYAATIDAVDPTATGIRFQLSVSGASLGARFAGGTCSNSGQSA